MAAEHHGDAPYVFLSYASADRAKALRVADLLEGRGVRVWIDRRSIGGGTSWSAEIVRGIERSAALILLCSRASMASPNVGQEVQLAWDGRRPSLPLILEQVEWPESVRYALAGRQWVDLLDRPDDAWLPDVLRALRQLGVDIPGMSPPAERGRADGGPAYARAYVPDAPLRPPTNLPSQLATFVGRERDVADLQRTLLDPAVRLVTLTGPGGVGKTRLALVTAARVLERFRDGVFVVSLAAIRDPDLLIPAMSQALDLTQSASRSPADGFVAHVRGRELLLLLDNFEQLVHGAPLLTGVLEACPGLKVLVTSRTSLHLRGEHEIEVRPLALPDTRRLPPNERLQECEAIRLFVERARSVRRDFELADDNAGAVAGICSRLDGLPLAIELAAARTKVLHPQALLARLERRLDTLTSGPSDLPPRLRTLRGALDWSHDLLPAAEQALFRRLAVFAGGAPLEAVATVVDPDGALDLDVFDGLASLVDQSLLHQDAGGAVEPRFGMLETIREYALDQLVAKGERDLVRDRHARYFLALAEEADGHLRGPRQVDWLDRLARERDNLRAAMTRVLETARAHEALRLGGALRSFWALRNHWAEGRMRLDEALALPDATPRSAERALALYGAGRLALSQRDYRAAEARFQESLDIRQELGDRPGLADSLSGLGWVKCDQGDVAGAQPLFESCLAIRRELGNQRSVAVTLLNLGDVALQRADHKAAGTFLEEARGLFQAAGDRTGGAAAAYHLGVLAFERGDLATAKARYAQSLALARELGLGEHIAVAIEGLAGIAAASGAWEGALRLAGFASALRDEVEAPPSPLDVVRLSAWLEPARQTIGEAAASASWQAGRAMRDDRGIDELLEDVSPVPATPRSAAARGEPGDVSRIIA